MSERLDPESIAILRAERARDGAPAEARERVRARVHASLAIPAPLGRPTPPEAPGPVPHPLQALGSVRLAAFAIAVIGAGSIALSLVRESPPRQSAAPIS